MEKKIQTDQFAELAAAVVQSLPRDLDPNTAQGWITNRKGLAKVLQEALVPPPEQELLTQVGTIKVRLDKNFNDGCFFDVNTEKNVVGKYSFFADGFNNHFLLPRVDEAVDSVPSSLPPAFQHTTNKTTLRYHTLNKNSLAGHIIYELGGEIKVETTLAEVGSCMKKQSGGEPGVLLTNGYGNIFYLRDIHGILCAVYVRWYSGSWSVRAYSVNFPQMWNSGSRVFSRA